MDEVVRIHLPKGTRIPTLDRLYEHDLQQRAAARAAFERAETQAHHDAWRVFKGIRIRQRSGLESVVLTVRQVRYAIARGLRRLANRVDPYHVR